MEFASGSKYVRMFLMLNFLKFVDSIITSTAYSFDQGSISHKPRLSVSEVNSHSTGKEPSFSPLTMAILSTFSVFLVSFLDQ